MSVSSRSRTSVFFPSTEGGGSKEMKLVAVKKYFNFSESVSGRRGETSGSKEMDFVEISNMKKN